MLTLPQATDQIGRYQILSELGRGSMGQVYLALDPNIDRRVALKVYLPALRVSAKERRELRRRFVLEAKAAGRVEHPGIVTIFDADTDLATDLSYIAMEWIDGRSLQEVLAETGPLSTRRTLEIVEQVAVALGAAHRQGLVHRDVKPGNILCGRDGVIKVTDFGIAKLASMSITHSNWIPGSPFYMSPEQLRNEDVDHRSDIYSLGAVLYECLTGMVPFEGDSLPSLTYMILEIDPRPPQTIDPSIDDTLARVAMRALAKSKHERFESALDFARALRGIEPPPRRARAPLAPGDPARRRSLTATLPTPPPAAAEAAGELAADTARFSSWVGWAALLLVVAAGVLGLHYGPWLAPADLESPAAVKSSLRVESPPRFGSPGASSGHPGDLALDPPPPPALEDENHPPASPMASPSAPARSHPEPATAPVSAPVAVPVTVPATLPVAVPAAPTERVAPPPVRAVVAKADLEIVFRNRLKDATLTLYVDGEETWTRALNGAHNFFRRSIGKDVWTTVPIPAGEHVIDVRVTGAEAKLDLVRRTEVSVAAGETRRLRVVLIPPKTLKLAWKDLGDG
jgi:serine/threonine-protein kinase